MLDLYTWTTPNGRKPLILLAELDLPYNLHPVDLRSGAQQQADYLRINRNAKIPALVDGAGTPEEVRIFESGAILLHLAEKAGRFLAPSGQARADALGWLMFQMSAVGPMFGQYFHFKNLPEPNPYGIERFRKEVDRIYGVLEGRLGEAEYLAGDYGIADIATFPWAGTPDRFGVDLATVPNVVRWAKAVGERPAVQKGMTLTMG